MCVWETEREREKENERYFCFSNIYQQPFHCSVNVCGPSSLKTLAVFVDNKYNKSSSFCNAFLKKSVSPIIEKKKNQYNNFQENLTLQSKS